MKGPGKVLALAGGLFVLFAVSSVFLLQRVDQLRSGATLEEFLYISSPKMLKRLSLGYDGLLADVYWTRAVQYYGGMHHTGGGRYELLQPLLHITTQLDPNLIPAYEFGSTFLAAKPPAGAGLPEKAIELVQYGISNNPDNWRLYYDLGFIYYDQKDYRNAAEAFLRGSKVPNAHPFLKILAAQMAEHGDETETAQMLWTAAYETTTDKYIRANAVAHLRALKAEQDVTQLEKIIQAYEQRTGRVPSSFRQLAAEGFLRGVPVDPLGNVYRLTRDGRVEVQDPDQLPFLEKGLPPGYVPPVAPRIAPVE